MSEVAKIASSNMGLAMESVLIDGDLSKLSAEQRVVYYHKVCESVGLNPLTRPFEYQRFNGKVQLYARKEASEQLRFIHKVSVYELKKETFDNVYVVTAYGRTADGKEDIATGAVTISGLKGEALANAFLKCETKAKRRLTLSICGLSFLDETEINTFPGSTPVKVNHETGVIEATMHEPYTTGTVLLSDKPAERTDEEVLADIDQEKINELAETIATAKDMDTLKDAYARAYVMHAKRPHLMTRLTDLKDMRKKQLTTLGEAVDAILFDTECPDLVGTPAQGAVA